MPAAQQRGRKRRIAWGRGHGPRHKDFVAGASALDVTPQVRGYPRGRRSNLDRRTTPHPGYAIGLGRR